MEKPNLIPFQKIVNFEPKETLGIKYHDKNTKINVDITESTLETFKCNFTAKYKTPFAILHINQFEEDEKTNFAPVFRVFHNDFLKINVGLGLDATAKFRKEIETKRGNAVIAGKSSVYVNNLFDDKKHTNVRSVLSMSLGMFNLAASYTFNDTKSPGDLVVMPHVNLSKATASLYFAPLAKKMGVCVSTSAFKYPLFMSLCHSQDKLIDAKVGTMLRGKRNTLRVFADSDANVNACAYVRLSKNMGVKAWCSTPILDAENAKYGLLIDFNK